MKPRDSPSSSQCDHNSSTAAVVAAVAMALLVALAVALLVAQALALLDTYQRCSLFFCRI